MPPIIRNIFIRIAAFFERIWNLFNQSLKQSFGFLGRLFGFTGSSVGYYVEEEQNNSSSNGQKKEKLAQAQSTSPQFESVANPATSSDSTRRPGAEMDYFRDMVRQVRRPQ